jgi:hypothetical protein
LHLAWTLLESLASEPISEKQNSKGSSTSSAAPLRFI